jgi:acetolactate synthase-1/2/3 large subunit
VRFRSPPDHAQIAAGCHAYGERVEDPAEVLPALRRGLENIASGRSAVLDMVIKPI